MGREIVKDYSQHACANQSSRLEEVHSCRTCAVWVHTDRSLKGLIGETAAHVSCLRAGDVSHCVYVESHHVRFPPLLIFFAYFTLLSRKPWTLPSLLAYRPTMSPSGLIPF